MEQNIQNKKQNEELLQPKKGSSRFLSYLNLKDIFDPIVIKRIHLVYAAGLSLILILGGIEIWKKYFAAPTGAELVDKMVGAAGGMQAWNNVDHGKFVRTQRLYDQTGKKLNEKVETVYFEKKNGDVELLSESTRPGQAPVVIGKDDKGFWALENGIFVDPIKTGKDLGVMCASKWCQPNCAMKMAFYRFSMPFKLKDNGVIAENGGKDVLFQIVNIGFSPEVGKDRWLFQIDETSHLIAKMEYHHKTDKGEALPEEFYWTDYRQVGGLMLSHKWMRYWGNGKPLEEITFSDFDFKSTLPNHFHARPNDLISAATTK